MLIKKFTLVLSLILFCLPTFAQEVIRYNAVDIIETEFEGIKVGSHDMGEQLLNMGYKDITGECEIFLYEPANLVPYSYYSIQFPIIYLQKGLMQFWLSNDSAHPDLYRQAIWKLISKQLSPNEECPTTISNERCDFLWRDKLGNCLSLIFDKNKVVLIVKPADDSQKAASLNISNSHEYVDLGLSVKWAKCNVGASRPEECGGYYQWAGTKDVISANIYLFYNNCPYHIGEDRETGWTKYNYDSSFGKVDNKKNLEPEDDIAHIMLGGRWRMPTDAEWYELISDCSWTWTTINGVKGCRV